eukprot:680769-Rhodomonas_salina.1
MTAGFVREGCGGGDLPVALYTARPESLCVLVWSYPSPYMHMLGLAGGVMEGVIHVLSALLLDPRLSITASSSSSAPPAPPPPRSVVCCAVLCCAVWLCA